LLQHLIFHFSSSELHGNGDDGITAVSAVIPR